MVLEQYDQLRLHLDSQLPSPMLEATLACYDILCGSLLSKNTCLRIFLDNLKSHQSGFLLQSLLLFQ